MKKLLSLIIVLFLTIFFCQQLQAQDSENHFDFQSEMNKPNADYYNIVKLGNEFYAEHPDEDEDGDYMEFIRWVEDWKPLVTGPGSTNGNFERAFHASQTLVINPVCNGSLSVPSQWTVLGPTNMPLHETGKITAIAALPSEPNLVYAGGSYGGGIFRTTQAAVGANPNWGCITDLQRFKTGQIADILIDPDNNANNVHNLFFLCQTGIFKSIDGGVTWIQSLALPVNGSSYDRGKLLMHPTNHQIIYAIGEQDEIYKTVDGGVSWQSLGLRTFLSTSVPVLFEKLQFLIFDPLDPDIIYSSGEGTHLLRFDPSLPGQPSQQWVDIKSSLTSISITPASNSESFRLSSTADNIYALCKNSSGLPEIYKSSDGGYTWIAHNQCNLTGSLFIVSPAQENVMYIGDNIGGRLVCKSVDGGQHFYTVTNYNPSVLYHGISTHGDIRAMKLINSTTTNGTGDDDFLIVGDDGGFLYSRSAYMDVSTPVINWTDLNGSGLCVTEFAGIGGYEQDPSYVMGGAQDDDIFRYYHGNWSVNVLCDGNDCVIDPSNPQVVYGERDCTSGATTKLVQSNDVGLSFGDASNTPAQNAAGRRPIFVNPISHEFYIAYQDLFSSQAVPPSYSLILNTAAANITKFRTNLNVPSCWAINAFDVSPDATNSVIYVGKDGPTWGNDMTTCDLDCRPGSCPGCTSCNCCPCASGTCPVLKKLWKSTNGGATWSDITDVGADGIDALEAVRWANISGITMNPDNTNEVYVCFDGFWDYPSGSGFGQNRVMQSLDGGQTWRDYSEGLNDFPTHSIKFQRGANAVYLATWSGVFYRKTDDPYPSGEPRV